MKNRHVWWYAESPESGSSHSITKVISVIDQAVDLPDWIDFSTVRLTGPRLTPKFMSSG